MSKGYAYANNIRDKREKQSRTEEEKTALLRMLELQSGHQIMSHVFIIY